MTPTATDRATGTGPRHQMTIEQIPELVVDNFAGGGGASTGIALAIGRSVDIAINHDPAAIAMHKTNHPTTRHYCESVWDVDPLEATQGQAVGLAWFSPDCTHHSKARGGKPRQKNIRGLAWVAAKWAALVSPRAMMLENVEEFQDWGPLDEDGQPIKERKGETFAAFVACLTTGLAPDHPAWPEIREAIGDNFPYHLLEQGLGYAVEWRELRACDYGAPTIRKRLFIVMRRDGKPIVWPAATHGDPKSEVVKAGRLKPWRTAAEIIDWSLPCPSIFDRERPLAENTLRRIARGIQKFVIDNPQPFIVQVNYSGATHHYTRPTDAPLSTITAKNGWALVAPFLAQYHSETAGRDARGQTMDRPVLTVDAANRYGLVAANLVHLGHGEEAKGKKRWSHGVRDAELPLNTITASGATAGLVTSHLVKLRGTCAHGQPVTEPMPTVTSGGLHVGEVRAFLVKYFATAVGQDCSEPLHTVTAKARFGLVTIEGEDYQIAGIGMRMLQPKELFAAQGFPADYQIERDSEGRRYSKAEQVARCGNAVPPVFSEALVKANLPELRTQYGETAAYGAAD